MLPLLRELKDPQIWLVLHVSLQRMMDGGAVVHTWLGFSHTTSGRQWGLRVPRSNLSLEQLQNIRLD